MAETQQAPRIQRRETWIDVPEYEGFRIKVWVNAPTRLWERLTAEGASEEERQEVLRQLVLEHNGWLDFDGEPYPPPGEAAFWQAIPTELAATIIVATRKEITALPNSLAPTKRR